MTADDDAWYLVFSQSALWWSRGQETLLFRRQRRRRDGVRPVALRSAPFAMGLPGALLGAVETEVGWRDHPAARAAVQHYGLPGGEA